MATPSVFQVKNRLGRGAPVGQHGPNPREGKRLGLAALAATVPAAAPVFIRQGQAAASTSMVHCRDRKRTALAEWPVFRDKGVAGSATCGPEKLGDKPNQHATLSVAAGPRFRPDKSSFSPHRPQSRTGQEEGFVCPVRTPIPLPSSVFSVPSVVKKLTTPAFRRARRRCDRTGSAPPRA
jgi:hypothetical protein